VGDGAITVDSNDARIVAQQRGSGGPCRPRTLLPGARAAVRLSADRILVGRTVDVAGGGKVAQLVEATADAGRAAVPDTTVRASSTTVERPDGYTAERR
jgi:hypothetical protein